MLVPYVPEEGISEPTGLARIAFDDLDPDTLAQLSIKPLTLLELKIAFDGLKLCSSKQDIERYYKYTDGVHN